VILLPLRRGKVPAPLFPTCGWTPTLTLAAFFKWAFKTPAALADLLIPPEGRSLFPSPLQQLPGFFEVLLLFLLPAAMDSRVKTFRFQIQSGWVTDRKFWVDGPFCALKLAFFVGQALVLSFFCGPVLRRGFFPSPSLKASLETPPFYVLMNVNYLFEPLASETVPSLFLDPPPSLL